MVKSYEELKQQADVIKNETSDGANTAKRIGTMFEDAIDFTDANIGQSVGLIVTDYKGTPEDTRMSVDARFRKKGSVMTYNPGTGYIMEQYIGTTLLDSEWQKGTNWRPYYADENIQNIAEYARSAGEEAQAKGAKAVQIAQTSGEEAKQIAQAAAEEASAQAAYAKEQGDLAATKGVGKVDSNSFGAGEIFNSYEGSYGNVASGSYSHAEGYGTTSDNYGTHAEGWRTRANGSYGAHAEGCGTIADGYGSHSSGFYTIANTYAQTAIGYKNTEEEIPSPDSYDATKAAFIIGNDGNAFKVLFNGQTFADGQYSSSGADYAEMFEWKDGNPDNEDRVGRFVTLKGKNIEIADETFTYILGIVSGAPTIIGDNPMRWQGKYLNDEWGRPIYEDVERVFVRNIKKKDGTIETKEDVKFQHIRKVNPNYDPMEKYIPRIERPEWDYVGMMGKLLVRQDGTLTEGGFCKPSANGVATTAESGYYVMEIINESQALILFR